MFPHRVEAVLFSVCLFWVLCTSFLQLVSDSFVGVGFLLSLALPIVWVVYGFSTNVRKGVVLLGLTVMLAVAIEIAWHAVPYRPRSDKGIEEPIFGFFVSCWIIGFLMGLAARRFR